MTRRSTITGDAIRDDTLTGDDINERTLKLPHVTMHRYTRDSGSNTALVRFSSGGSDGTGGDQVNNKFVVPTAGKLLMLKIRSTNAMGSTELAMMRVEDGTVNFGSPGTPAASVTVDVASANTTYTANFSSGNDFGTGDIVGIRINPANNHGSVDVTAVWELDWNA